MARTFKRFAHESQGSDIKGLDPTNDRLTATLTKITQQLDRR
eukprot:COSAG02_NODE_44081_length_369_cov_0.748148_1_plen_41_part_10